MHAVVQKASCLYFQMLLQNRVMLFSFLRRGALRTWTRAWFKQPAAWQVPSRTVPALPPAKPAVQPEKQRETLGVTIHLVPALILPAPSRVTVRKAPGALVSSRGCAGGSAATQNLDHSFSPKCACVRHCRGTVALPWLCAWEWELSHCLATFFAEFLPPLFHCQRFDGQLYAASVNGNTVHCVYGPYQHLDIKSYICVKQKRVSPIKNYMLGFQEDPISQNETWAAAGWYNLNKSN